jgi:hypothetical protein
MLNSAIESELPDNEPNTQQEEEVEHPPLSMKEIEDVVYNNRMNLFGKTFPLLSSKDILEKYSAGCFYCFLHAEHTPCGPQLHKWKECSLENPKEEGSTEITPCDEIFQTEFWPCFSNYAGTEYYKLRLQLVIDSKNKDLIKLHHKIQRRAIHNLLNKKYQF